MNKWEKVGNEVFRLNQDDCYPGTLVEVFLSGYKKWRVRLTNTEDAPPASVMPNEVSRKRGKTASVAGWATAATAKKKAIEVHRNRKWLEQAGIKFALAHSAFSGEQVLEPAE